MRYAKTPTIFQMEATECGAASLSMIMAYFGHYVPLEKMRIETGVSRDGCNARNILKAARKYGLECKAFRKDPEALIELPVPSIIHWEFNHFVVFEGTKGGYAYINDPAMGRRKLSMEELDGSFTGIVLTFKRTSSFVKKKKTDTLLSFVTQRLSGQKSTVGMLILLGILLAVPGIVIPVFSEIFVDEILINGNRNWINGLLLAMIISICFQAILAQYKEILLVKLQSKLALISGVKFLEKMFSLPIAFFDQRLPGDLSERVDYNYSVSLFLAGDLAETAISIFMAVLYLVILIIYSPQLTIIGVILLAINITLVRIASSSMANMLVKYQQDKSKFVGSLYSGVSISSSLKSTGTENEYVARLLGFYANNAIMEQSFGLKQQILSAIPEVSSQLTNVLILILGGVLVIKGSITSGMLVAYTSLFASFISPINGLLSFIQKIQTTKADMNRVEDIEKYSEGDKSKKGSVEKQDLKSKLSGAVRLENISFGYNILQDPLIKDFSFDLPVGNSIALVGGSGSGKSTIAKVVSGLYSPWEGNILYDGMPLDSISHDVLHASVSVVNQNISIFCGSIRDNITMWNESILEEDIVKAAKDACIHELITQKDGAYEYKLTEGGGNLSGGQRQRLEIARALATNPTILIMDEATSALDPLVEKEILDNIKRRGCTCVVVAHRLSAIRDCDEIVVLKQGQVMERGTHTELLQMNGIYSSLMQNL